MYTIYSAQLRAARAILKLTTDYVAESLHISKATLSKIEISDVLEIKGANYNSIQKLVNFYEKYGIVFSEKFGVNLNVNNNTFTLPSFQRRKEKSSV